MPVETILQILFEALINGVRVFGLRAHLLLQLLFAELSPNPGMKPTLLALRTPRIMALVI
jgi:hypothetical protein